MSGPAELDIPLDRPGRTFGAMRLPWSHDESAYGQIVIPVIVINGAPGTTVLATAGVHGDEYEGQVALSDLARDIEPSSLRGRLIIVPAANAPAAAIGRRNSPVDGGNLARVFPGKGDGALTAQIAEGITRLLLPEADFVIDMHSGGRTLEYIPCGWARLPADTDLRARTLDALIAFGAPDAGVVAKPQALGTFLAAAQSAGRDLGGAGRGRYAHTLFVERGARRYRAVPRLRGPDRAQAPGEAGAFAGGGAAPFRASTRAGFVRARDVARPKRGGGRYRRPTSRH
jgi:predicted deacylase